jgi:hypothetical protein
MPAHGTFGKAEIAAGASLSSAVNVDYAIALWINVPTWTDTAVITFQVQHDGNTTFFEATDELGQAIQLPNSTHNVSYLVPALVGAKAIKVRSGTAGAAQNQTAAETITVFGLR